jgi:hypothetical protein
MTDSLLARPQLGRHQQANAMSRSSSNEVERLSRDFVKQLAEERHKPSAPARDGEAFLRKHSTMLLACGSLVLVRMWASRGPQVVASRRAKPGSELDEGGSSGSVSQHGDWTNSSPIGTALGQAAVHAQTRICAGTAKRPLSNPVSEARIEAASRSQLAS